LKPGRRATRGVSTRRRVWAVAVTAAVVVGLDQTTKTIALDRLANGPKHLAGPLSLALSFNSGIAFSLGTGLTLPIVVIGVLVVAILVWFARSTPSYAVAIGIGLLLGGAAGNLADRVFRAHGLVVDFVHVGFWPTFNCADAAIVVGAAILVARFWRQTGVHGAAHRGAPGGGE